MAKVKKFKVKEQSGRFSEVIPLGADAENIDVILNSEEGVKTLQNLQSYIDTLEMTLLNLQNEISEVTSLKWQGEQ